MLGIYLVLGAFAGMMSGLFGIGGGVVIIPALATIFLHHTDIPMADIMQMAVGTSLATIVVTSTSSMYAHHKHSAVVWPQVQKMVLWLMLGAVIGAGVAHFLPSRWLKDIFSVFLAVVSLRMFFPGEQKESAAPLALIKVRISSVAIGILSSILGVGGGTLLVPFLLHCQLDMRQATGTSVACGFAVGSVATICFMVTGLFAGLHIPWSTGYIYWPAFLGIAFASLAFAPMGASLAHKLPKKMLQKIFATFLLIMAVDMMFFSR